MGARAIVAVIVVAVLKLVINQSSGSHALVADVHAIGSFVEVIGGLYGLVVAFVIFVVWDQFNGVAKGIRAEAAALEDLCRLSGLVSDRGTAVQLRGAVKQYMEATANDEASRIGHGEHSSLAEEKFTAMGTAVRRIPANHVDDVFRQELLRAFVRVSDARDERLSVSATRIPPTLWAVVWSMSITLIGGFLALTTHTPGLSVIMVSAAAGSLVLLLSVIADMDNPFTGAWRVSYSPLREAVARVSTS